MHSFVNIMISVLLLVVKIVTGSSGPYLRKTMMYEQEHHNGMDTDGMGTMHPSDESYMHSTSNQEQSSNIVTYCEPPLGPIQEHWWYPNDTGMHNRTCNSNINVCCGPLLEFRNCTEPAKAFPGLWTEGICLGYSEKDCCLIEDGHTYFTFTNCSDSQGKIVGEWEGFKCKHYTVSECCGPLPTVTSSNCPISDYVWPCDGPCCGVQQNWTFCPPKTERWPVGWSNDVCFGLMEECCYAPDSIYFSHRFPACYENQRPIPGKWDQYGLCTGVYLSECCGVPENIYSCPESYERWPVGWNDDVCFGFLQECCYNADLFDYYDFPSCYESQEKILEKWEGDICNARRVSDCCSDTPQNFDNCTEFVYEWPCSGNCCAEQHKFNSCPPPSVQMPGWTDDGCVGRMTDCCHIDDGNDMYTYTSCPESQQKILENWFDDSCKASSMSTCCAMMQSFTKCSKETQPWPGKWHDGVCLGSFDDCCYEQTHTKYYNFPACFESQEQIPGRWMDSMCTATTLSDCCHGTFTTVDGLVYFSSSSKVGSSISGLVVGIVVALASIVWL